MNVTELHKVEVELTALGSLLPRTPLKMLDYCELNEHSVPVQCINILTLLAKIRLQLHCSTSNKLTVLFIMFHAVHISSSVLCIHLTRNDMNLILNVCY